MSTDYYSVLGVSPSATEDEIKRLYKKLAVKYHPDKTNDPNLHQKFILIQEAYDTLKDPLLKAKYDLLRNLQTPRYGYSSYSANYSPSGNYRTSPKSPYTNASSYSYYASSSYLKPSSSYFGWQQLNSRTYTDAYNRKTKEEEERSAKAAAEKVRQQMLNRKKQEYMAEAQKIREREQREKLEREAQERKEKARREAQERKEQEYEQAKQKAHQEQWHTQQDQEELSSSESEYESIEEYEYQKPHRTEEDDDDIEEDYLEEEEDNYGSEEEYYEEVQSGPGRDLTQPIIVEDDEDDEDDLVEEEIDEEDESVDDSGRFEDCQSAPPTDTVDPNQLMNQEDLDGSESLHGAPETPQDGPEIVEVPEDPEISDFSRPGSPQKPYGAATPKFSAGQQRPRTESSSKAKLNFKKPRFADMSEMRETLGTNLEDVSFEDMRDNLPDNAPAAGARGFQKTRKASATMQSSSKRPRVAEYTDGLSRAQTLFTPINRTTARFHNSTILPSDLAPDVDENTLVFNVQPPKLEVTLALTHTQWDAYVDSIQAYERRFAKYRQAVFKFQMGRMEKDERHHNIIYSDVSCLDVYNTCLFNDMVIVQGYHRALQEFKETLISFRRNCEMVNAMETGNVY